MRHVSVLLLLAAMLVPRPSFGGDGATVIFKSGHVMFLDNGFKELTAAMKNVSATSHRHKMVEFNTGQGNFVLNAAEIVGVCRDRCKLDVRDLRDPARGGR